MRVMNPVVEPPPVVNIGPPNIDFFHFFTTIFEKLSDWYPSIFGGAKSTIGILVGISFPISLFLLIAIIYTIEQLKLIRKKEKLMYDTKTEPAYQETAGGNVTLAGHWENVIRHIESP